MSQPDWERTLEVGTAEQTHAQATETTESDGRKYQRALRKHRPKYAF